MGAPPLPPTGRTKGLAIYSIDTAVLLKGRRTAARGVRVSRNVVLLGTVSLFTDISSEMVSTILPLYLVFSLGASPLQFGIIDGLYQGASALVRVAAGFVADRWRRHKEIAGLGYGLSAICKLGFLVLGGATAAIGAIVLIDRTGKGIRTAPRDALISLSSTREQLGTAFGVHRAMDTVGAMLGPLVAFGLLLLAPGEFHPIFIVSFCFAMVGLSVLALFVENRPQSVPATAEPVSLRSAAAMLRVPALRRLAIVGGGLGLATMSDAFLYLGLQRRMDFDPSFFPLLFVGTSVAFMLLAVPMGRLADRVGAWRVFVGGYGLLLITYTALLLPSLTSFALFAYLGLFGAYYAATDGVLMAMGSALLPPELRASGLSFLVTATSVARLFASLLFGALWTWLGIQVAVLAFGAGLLVALVVAAALLARPGAEARHA